MNRRRFLLVSLAGVSAATVAAEVQQAGKMVRVGILGVGRTPSPQELARSVAANPFWLSMKELGWVEGRNMLIERRFGESTEQLRRGAEDLAEKRGRTRCA